MDGTTPRGLQAGFALRLKQARIAAGFESAAEFARAIGVSADLAQLWERAKRNPSDTQRVKIIDELGVTSDWLMYGRSHDLDDATKKRLRRRV